MDQKAGDLLSVLDRLEHAIEIESRMSHPSAIPKPVQSAIEMYGLHLLKNKQWDKAQSYFIEALNRMPTHAKSYLGIALALEGSGDMTNAKKYAEIAVKIWSETKGECPELSEARRLTNLALK